jgi:hypothetical protein
VGDRARSYRTRFSESDDPSGESFTFNDHWKRPRDMYAHQNRINELYFDYATGPFFIRVGKQGHLLGRIRLDRAARRLEPVRPVARARRASSRTSRRRASRSGRSGRR